MEVLRPAVLFFILTVSSCKVAEKEIAGTYYPEHGQRTRLQLNRNRTFEFALLNPSTDTLIFHETSPSNFYTLGHWEYDKKGLLLKSIPDDMQPLIEAVNDSITHFTSISSMNFWNRYGEPVPIRFILLPPSRTKPHFGNSLYFFAQDFKPTDTLRFYFDGYPRFDFPGSIPSTIGNNMHKIIFNEPYRPSPSPSLNFIVKKNWLIYEGGKLKFKKKN